MVSAQSQHMNNLCPVCKENEGGNKLGHLAYATTDSNPLASSFDVVCCQKCGFVFCDTPSSQHDYDTFYLKSFYSSSYITRILSKSEIRYFDQIATVLRQYIPGKNSAVFDIGCGVGNLLGHLKAMGYTNLYGVDPAPPCVDLLRQKKGLRAACGSVSAIPFSDQKADVVILSHILEHIVDTETSLASIRSKLSDEGLVYIEVPDASRYDSFEGVSPVRYFYFQHLIHFDRNHLVNLLETNGFKEIATGNHVRVEGELQMPCIWGVFKKNTPQMPPAVNSCFQLAELVKRWFKNADLDPEGVLTKLAANKTPIYVWGIGTHMQMMLAMSPLRHCNIKAFIDKDARMQKETINGRPICSLTELDAVSDLDTVIIGAPTHSHEMNDYLTNEVGFMGQVVVCGFGDIMIKQQGLRS